MILWLPQLFQYKKENKKEKTNCNSMNYVCRSQEFQQVIASSMARMSIKTIKTPGWRQLSSVKNSGEFNADFERNRLIELEFFWNFEHTITCYGMCHVESTLLVGTNWIIKIQYSNTKNVSFIWLKVKIGGGLGNVEKN